MRNSANVLVTGGAGFIGSHTVAELIKAGYNTIIVDNLTNAKEETLDHIYDITKKSPVFYNADIRDTFALDEIFKAHDISAVIHFAALKAVGESVLKPLAYYDNNIGGSLSLLSAMQKARCKTIIFSSSATVYGSNNPIPYLETYETSAIHPYAFTKVAVERILGDLCKAQSDWRVALLRYFNPIGAHESGLLGEDPNDIPNNLMPYICQVASGKLDHLNVFGGDYDTPDGTGVRDYIHVVDVALGHIAALEYALSHSGIEAVNLGTGKGTSVLELVRVFECVSGKHIPYEITKRRDGDIAKFYANTDKAKKLYGFSATRGIEQMCRDSWNFAKNNF